MPTYDLTCQACGKQYELFVTRLLRDDDKVCSSCGSTDVVSGIGGAYVGTPTRAGQAPCTPRGGFG